MTFTIRPVRATDRSAAAALAPRLLEGVAAWRSPGDIEPKIRGWVEEALDGALAEPTEGDPAPHPACYVAEDDGRVIGFISVSASTHWSGATEAYIGELMVDPEAEGRGVGRRLVDTALAWARDHDLERIVLDTGAANHRARAFYSRLGFDEEDIRLSREVDPGPRLIDDE